MKKTHALALTGVLLFGAASAVGFTASDFYAVSSSKNNSIETGTLQLKDISVTDPLFYTYPLEYGGDGLWQPGMKSAPKTMAIENIGTLEAEIYTAKIKQGDFSSLDPASLESLKKNMIFTISDTSRPGSSIPVLTATYGELLEGKDLGQSRILRTIKPGNTASYAITAELSREAGNELQGMVTKFDFVFQARDYKESN